MLETNCDLFSLANWSCRLFSWISLNSRTFSIAITAWSANVSTSSICFCVNGHGGAVHGEEPNGNPLSQQRHHEDCAKATQFRDFVARVFRVSKNIGNLNGFTLQHDSADRGPASRRKGLSPHVFKVLERVTVVRGGIIAPMLSGRTQDLRLIRLA